MVTHRGNYNRLLPITECYYNVLQDYYKRTKVSTASSTIIDMCILHMILKIFKLSIIENIIKGIIFRVLLYTFVYSKYVFYRFRNWITAIILTKID